MKGNKIFDFSRKGFQDIINIMTRKINECVDISNGLIPTLDEYMTKVDWNKIINSDLYQNVLGELDKTNEQLDNIVTEPTFEIFNNTVTLGNELCDATGWTSTGWTGDFASGFTHTVGNVNPITKNIGVEDGKLYQVSFKVEPIIIDPIDNSTFTVQLGDSVEFVTYRNIITFDFGIKCVGSSGLIKITPHSEFNRTITAISVKEIISPLPPSLTFKDRELNSVLEFRVNKDYRRNTFIGKNSGQYNTTGDWNVGVGEDALANNTSGYWNTALGCEALKNNTVGTRNCAIGKQALRDNISGDRNYAIGTYTLMRNTTGRQNVAMGADTMWVNTIGSYNVAIGAAVMGENVSGNENIAIGRTPLDHNVSGSYNIAIGTDALRNGDNPNYCVALGYYALKNNSAEYNVGIGYSSLGANTTGYNNVGIGRNALAKNKTGYESTAIGCNAGFSSLGKQCTFIGAWAGYNTTGINNTFIGANAGKNVTTGTGNIIIGRDCDLVNPTDNNKLNIGNIIFGDLGSLKKVGIGVNTPTARLHLQGGTGSPGTASLKLQAGTVLSVKEDGAFEYDGTKLYFTIGSDRKEIAFV